MKKPEAPCKFCDKQGCGAYHDICDKYQRYVTELEAFNDGIKKANREHSDMMSYMARIFRR